LQNISFEHKKRMDFILYAFCVQKRFILILYLQKAIM